MADTSQPAGPSSAPKRNRNHRRPKKNNTVDSPAEPSSQPKQAQQPSKNNRRAKFNAGLTGNDSAQQPQPQQQKQQQKQDQQQQQHGEKKQQAKKQNHRPNRRKPDPPPADDLTSQLTHQLKTPPYPDCLICFNSIRPGEPIWSCNPTLPTIGETEQYCWTVIHLRCIKPWAKKSVKDYEEALRNRGEEWSGLGEWRCPGCQGRRRDLVTAYLCFCGKVVDPSPPRLATPHSCASPCSRLRSKCSHPCPLSCHPGPCPSCKISVPVHCSCPKALSGQVKCADLAGQSTASQIQQGSLRVSILPNGEPSVSCGSVCNKVKRCGKPDHRCDRICHEGHCDPCVVPVRERCVCMKEFRTVECESHRIVEGASPSDVAEELHSDWRCDTPCDFPFSCGHHSCRETCHSHPPSSTSCPSDPAFVRTCPCGKSTIALPDSSEPAVFPARTSCQSPIPTCTQPCLKIISACGHSCARKCHKGPCTPCQEDVVRPCRCGSKVLQVKCHEFYGEHGEEKELLCDKPCRQTRSCGRHECNRKCCPLASLAIIKNNKKGKGKQQAQQLAIESDAEGLHLCDLICNKTLSCGNHKCTERDHKGSCPPCLQSTWDELVCSCGKTTMYPPIPCGVTKVECHERCHRGPLNPNCGLHPMVDHRCHPDDEKCPPCAFLVSKRCACDKTTINNVRCSMEKERVGCGKVCGKVMQSCGVHRCTKVCHPPSKEEAEVLGLDGGIEGGGCGECKATCGKIRKSCLPLRHPCTRSCHAPSACLEDDPCEAVVTLTCPCGRISRGVQCGRTATTGDETPSASNGFNGSTTKLKCTSECAIAKRNARLADALGIKPHSSSASTPGDVATYNDELVAYARANPKFLSLVEKTFAEFVHSTHDKKVLPHTPPDRRKFVCDLLGIYRMDYQLVDSEPHRSVQLIRRIDTRIPSPLLSQVVSTGSFSNPSMSSATTPLGRLTDLRAPNAGGTSSWRSPPPGVSGSSSSRSTGGLQPLGGSSNAAIPTGKGWATQRSSPVPAWKSNASTAAASLRKTDEAPFPQSAGVPSGSTGVVSGSSTPTAAPNPVDVPDNWEDD